MECKLVITRALHKHFVCTIIETFGAETVGQLDQQDDEGASRACRACACSAGVRAKSGGDEFGSALVVRGILSQPMRDESMRGLWMRGSKKSRGDGGVMGIENGVRDGRLGEWCEMCATSKGGGGIDGSWSLGGGGGSTATRRGGSEGGRGGCDEHLSTASSRHQRRRRRRRRSVAASFLRGRRKGRYSLRTV